MIAIFTQFSHECSSCSGLVLLSVSMYPPHDHTMLVIIMWSRFPARETPAKPARCALGVNGGGGVLRENATARDDFVSV